MISPIRSFATPKVLTMTAMLGAAALGVGLKAQTKTNTTPTADTKNLPNIVNTNRPEYLPKDAIPYARLLTMFDINGNRIIEDNEMKGLRKVLESGGTEQWDIYDKNGHRVGYVLDGSSLDADPSDTYEYAALNENNKRSYYARVNIYTGDEIFIKYTYDETGDHEEVYHNKNIESGINVEYTGPNKDKPKKMTEIKAIYERTDEYLLDDKGEIIIDEETWEPKRKEVLVGYQTVITEYEYDKDFNMIGVPKVTRKFVPVENTKHIDIQG